MTEPARISSRNNPTVKAIRKLERRKVREAQGRTFAEGIRVSLTALEVGAAVETLVLAPELPAREHRARALELAAQRDVPVLEVSAEVFESLSHRSGQSGMGVVVERRFVPLHEANPRQGVLWLALDGVQYPGNLGTILRSADAVGAGGVILIGECTDPYDPQSLRASKGTAFTLPLVRSDARAFRRWCQNHGVATVCAAVEGALDYRQARFPRPMVLLLGSEQHGLSEELERGCTLSLKIPMAGHADSLNLAVAAGVLLFEARAQIAGRGPKRDLSRPEDSRPEE